MLDMDNKLLEVATSYIPDPSYIIDLYDMHFAWADNGVLNLSGYTMDELKDLRNVDLITPEMPEKDFRKGFLARLAKGEGKEWLPAQGKDGKRIRFYSQYKVFKHDGGMYMVGKGLEVQVADADGRFEKVDIEKLKHGL